MDWFHHPKLVPVRNEVLDDLKRSSYHFRRLKPTVFLCGGRDSVARDHIETYLIKNRPDLLLFRAEEVWPIIAGQAGGNALEMEGQLAELADVVMIIVESPGTLAELGAFSLNDDLRKKLLPILDSRHQNDESFIKTGPVRWIDGDSIFQPSIWCDHRLILEAMEEIEQRLSRIPKPAPQRKVDIANSRRHLLFFMCDLIAIMGPCTLVHIYAYLDHLLPTYSKAQVPLLVGLATALKLVTLVRTEDGESYFRRPMSYGEMLTFQYKKKYVNHATLRAKMVSVMLAIRDDNLQSLLLSP